ncbi:MAG: DUF4010 domain-containing protein [Burkholderiales bacterium]|nr:MAG: DUF4010 domain-containing protein [Burkholderiales bacterium]
MSRLAIPPPDEPLAAAAVLAAALGCGLLVGIERERRKGRGPTRAFAGLRTFALTAVLGAAAALSGVQALVVVGALAIAGLALLAAWRDRSDDPGVTTEVALLLTYLIGVLCATRPVLAAALAVALTGLLAARQHLHRWASEWLRQGEVRDGLILAALALMALPLVPDRPLWGESLNPHLIVKLLVVLLGVQSLAHLSRRLLEARQAVALSALASGFVSSTATIASFGLLAREGRTSNRLLAGGALLSCVSTLLQLLLVAAAVRPAWLGVLWLPSVAGAALALMWGVWLVRGAGGTAPGTPLASPRIEGLVRPADDRMFNLRGAAAVAVLLVAVQTGVTLLKGWLGTGGLLAGALLAALADLHAAAAAVFLASTPGQPGAGGLVLPLALLVHATSKTITAGVSGGWPYLRWLVPGLWIHTGLAVGLLMATGLQT